MKASVFLAFLSVFIKSTYCDEQTDFQALVIKRLNDLENEVRDLKSENKLLKAKFGIGNSYETSKEKRKYTH